METVCVWGGAAKRQLAWQMTGFSFPVTLYITHESPVLKLYFLMTRGESVTLNGWENKCIVPCLSFLSMTSSHFPPTFSLVLSWTTGASATKPNGCGVTVATPGILRSLALGNTDHYATLANIHSDSLPSCLCPSLQNPPPPPPLLFNLWYRKGRRTELFRGSHHMWHSEVSHNTCQESNRREFSWFQMQKNTSSCEVVGNKLLTTNKYVTCNIILLLLRNTGLQSSRYFSCNNH